MTLPGYTPPPDSTPLAETFEKIRDLADAIGDAWDARVSLVSKLSVGFTENALGAFDIRRFGPDREIRGFINGTFGASATVTFATGLDVGDRPSVNAFAFAYLSSGNPGSAFIRSNGELAIANMTTGARTNAQFTIRYTVDV